MLLIVDVLPTVRFDMFAVADKLQRKQEGCKDGVSSGEEH